ncbi:DNA topoisomerase 2 [Tanacetum coccineum]|uniref:DNA topoisomerase 2 n=1 Tax=Tanacetum coccineum TaxID=301880 RepID=A0ABQ5B9N8_9ASTR
MQTEKQTDSRPQNETLWISRNEETPLISPVKRVQQTSWISPFQRTEETLWIWEDDEMIEKTITFVPLLYQIFDGILISAADVRKGVKDILVKIDVADNNIGVWNHGEGVYDLTYSQLQVAQDFMTGISIQMGDGIEVSKEVLNTMGEKLKEFSISEKWCMVSFKPNLAKFGLKNLEDDILALLKRRVVDLAGCCSGVKVELDGTSVLPRTFKDYVELYLEASGTHTMRICEKVNDRWEICVAVADGHLEHFDQVSFVNNIATMKGGSHVEYITSQITDYLAEIVDLQPNEIKRYLWVFVNAHIDDPTFDSQTKEKLTTNEGSFGSTCQLTPEFLEKSNGTQFEGSSHEGIGVKTLNCQNIRLRRFLASKRDHDGLETKGLLINFIHYFWPSLLQQHYPIPQHYGIPHKRLMGKVKNFLCAFIAPIVKASHKKTNKVFLFYSMPEYDAWKEKFGNNYNIKYYKGQETIESEDIGEYDFDQHVKDFVWENDEDGDAIELAFSPMKIEKRKDWLQAPQDGTDFDRTKKSIRYLDFINQEFKQYAIADIQRSIPSMVDGLKPHQRKILFYAFKKPIIQTTQVNHFCSYVFEHSPYDVEGEASLVGTIIGMAQNFVGSNNVNLLQPDGQFGTRVMGGKDHADGRLLFTRLSPITRYLFHEDDQLLLNYLIEDGQSIDHAWFIPIIPIVLLNGSEATGAWSSFIPNYNPRDVIANLKRLLAGDDMVSMLPWYKAFKGDIKETKTTSNHTSYTTTGKMSEDANALTITITDLPIRTWTEDYRQFLFLEAASGKDIKAYKDRNYTSTSVDFEVTMTEDQMNRARQEGGLLNRFKLTTTLSTDNMYLLDKDAVLKKYDTPQQILEDFFHIRLHFYEKRKTDLVRQLEIASLVLENKIRFINEYLDGNIVLFRKPMDVKCAVLEAKGFQSLASIVKAVDQLQGEGAADASDTTRYDYLLAIAIPAFEDEDIKKMEQELYAKKEKIVYLNNTSIKDLWRKDLEALDDQLDFEGYPESKAKLAGQSANKKRRMHIAFGMCLISYLSCYHLMLFSECSAKVSAVAGWGN